MDIHDINETNMSWEVVHLSKKAKPLFSTYRVREVVSSLGWMAVQT